MNLNISANSLPQLFENVGRELLRTLINPEDVGETLREKVVIEAADASALLQEWIQTLLRLTRDQHILCKAYRFQLFEVERTGAGKLKAEITGELVDPARHTFKIDPAEVVCERIQLINNSKMIEAQVVLKSTKLNLAI
jgi:SHS2 domain-containing protein